MNRKITFYLVLMVLNMACYSENVENNAPTVSADSTKTIISKPIDNKRIAVENSFEEVDPTMFNKTLSQQKKKLSPEEIIKLYYPAVIPKDDHSFQNIKTETKIEGDKTIVTLTHDNQPHITIQGHRIVMALTKEKGEWKVLSIAQQFKCWMRKGGVVWSSDRCLK